MENGRSCKDPILTFHDYREEEKQHGKENLVVRVKSDNGLFRCKIDHEVGIPLWESLLKKTQPTSISWNEGDLCFFAFVVRGIRGAP